MCPTPASKLRMKLELIPRCPDSQVLADLSQNDRAGRAFGKIKVSLSDGRVRGELADVEIVTIVTGMKTASVY